MLFDEEMMLKALEQAEKAFELGECPVGAVITDKNGEIIAEGYNRRETDNSPTAHAEIIATIGEMADACAKSLGCEYHVGSFDMKRDTSNSDELHYVVNLLVLPV